MIACKLCGRVKRYKGRRQAKALRCACRRPARPRYHPDRPTVPEVLPRAIAIYASPGGSVGGHLHVVLEDLNCHPGFLEGCVEWAREDGCRACEELAYLLSAMSRTQISKVARGAARSCLVARLRPADLAHVGASAAGKV